MSTLFTRGLLVLIAVTLVACGGAGPHTKRGAKSGARKAAAAADVDAAQSHQRKLTEADFQVRNIEEVKAPKYVEGIDQEAQNLFKQGLVAVMATPPRWDLAEDKFRAAIKRDGKFNEAYFNLGMTLERRGARDEALEVYEDALDANPDDVSARAYIAKIYLGKAQHAKLIGNTDEYTEWLRIAKELLDKLNVQDPRNVPVNNGLALYFLAHNDLETAERYVKEVLYVDPRNVTGLNTRGLINLVHGRYYIAEWIFKNKVLHEDPHSTEALTNLGYTYIKLDQRPLAMKYFKMALAEDADNMAVRMNIAAMLLEHLDYAEALKHYTIIRDAQPINIEAHEGFCDATYGLGGSADDGKVQFQVSIDCYVVLLKRRPERVELYKRIAETYQNKIQDLDKAVEFYRAYIDQGNLEADELKKMEGTILVLEEIISKGGLKAMEEMMLEDDEEEGDDGFESFDEEDEGAEEAPPAEEGAEEAPPAEEGAEEAPPAEEGAEEAPTPEDAGDEDAGDDAGDEATSQNLARTLTGAG